MASSKIRRVLIVDDNVQLADNVAEILRMDGHDAEVAASAEEALPRALQAEPDVLLADYRLPGINGAQFVREFCGSRAHVVAIVMSAYTDEATIREATEAGASFIAKPLDFERLVGWVRSGTA